MVDVSWIHNHPDWFQYSFKVDATWQVFSIYYDYDYYYYYYYYWAALCCHCG